MLDDEDDSSGLFGTILSLILLAILWPYILAAIGIFIAYLLFLELLNWISGHWVLTIVLVASLISIYLIIKLKLIQYALLWIWEKIKPNDQDELTINQEIITSTHQKFVSSTNLYCYLCTKKLGVQALELNGKYFCKKCFGEIN